MSQQIDSAPVLTSNCYANRKWMLREHHGWRALVKKFSTRAEFDDAIADAISDAAETGDKPCLMTRREFLECDYYEAKFDGLDPQTTHVLCKSMDDIVEFTDEAAAQTALDEAINEYGVDQLTSDRGGHSGCTERLDVSDINVGVQTPAGRFVFKFDDKESPLPTSDDLSERGIPAEYHAGVIEQIEHQLQLIANE